MKKTIIILLSLAALVMTGCSDFLKEAPTTRLAESSVFSTEANIQANLTGCYQAFNSSKLWKGEWDEFVFLLSGLITRKSNNSPTYGLYPNAFACVPTEEHNESTFTALYAAVNRCNNVIVNMQDESSQIDESFRKEAEAEARLLRAVAYFSIVRMWGDAPLLVTATASLDDAHNPRTPFWEIYAQVLEDLDFAETYMRDKSRVEEVTPGLGRPNKWAATAFKSSVYLTIGSLLTSPNDNFWDTSKRTPDFSACGISSSSDAFKLAYDCAMQVIQSGTYKLESDYRTLFRWTEPGDWTLEEGILTLQNDGITSSYLAQRSLPQGYHTKKKNSNHGRHRPSRWAIENFIMRTGGTKGTGNYNKDVYAHTDDPRFNASYIHEKFTNEYDSSLAGTPTYPNDTKQAFSAMNVYVFTPYCKKYYDPTYDYTYGNFAFYLMRYAEVYLIAAESAAWLSNSLGDDWSQKAMDNVNVIRKRARLSNDEKVELAAPADFKAADFKDIDDLRYGIWWERWIELGFEGHEWFDVRRFGANWLSEKIAKPANVYWAMPVNKTVGQTVIPGRTVEEGLYVTDPSELRKGLLAPFPQAELTQNKALTEADQNDFFYAGGSGE